MIFALLAILFFGSGDSSLTAIFDRVEERIGETVKDRARRKEVLEITDDAKDATKAYAKARRAILDEWIALGKSASSTEAEYRALVDRLRNEAAEYESTMIRQRFALKSKMTREEWSATFAAPAPVSVRLADLAGTNWTCTRIEGIDMPEGAPRRSSSGRPTNRAWRGSPGSRGSTDLAARRTQPPPDSPSAQ